MKPTVAIVVPVEYGTISVVTFRWVVSSFNPDLFFEKFSYLRSPAR